MANKRLNMDTTHDLTTEANALIYLQDHRGKMMSGETRKLVYELYQAFFNDGRTEKTCSCMDSDTVRKVDAYIMNNLQWSDKVRMSDRFAQVFPSEVLEVEEVSTQQIDMDEVLTNMQIKTTIPPEDAEKLEKKKPARKKRTTKKKE